MAGPEIRENVTVAGRAERARVARGFVDGVLGPGVPELARAGRDAEGGRELQLVAASRRAGWRRRGGRTVTWFELSHG